MVVVVGQLVSCAGMPESDSELVGTGLSKGAEMNRRAVGLVCVLIDLTLESVSEVQVELLMT